MSHENETKMELNQPAIDETELDDQLYDDEEDEDDYDLHNFNEVHECAHVFHDGNTCMNVAGPGQHFCRWHRTAAEREERREAYTSRKRYKKAIPDLEIPTIEDPESLQIAIHEVMDAIIDGRVTDRRAGWLLYGLQLSRSNVKRKLHFTKMNYSVFNLMSDLEEARQEKIRQEQDRLHEEQLREREAERAQKKPPQSVRLSEVKNDFEVK